jgi:hypothetical protein
MGSRRSPFARAGLRTAVVFAAFVAALALAGPADANTHVLWDRADTPSPLDIRYAAHGHADDDTVTATLAMWEPFRSGLLTGPNMIAIGFYRHGVPYRWAYVSRRNDGLHAVVKSDGGDVIGSATASRPSGRSVLVRIPVQLLGDPAGYRWVAFTAARNARACARTCTDAVRGVHEYVSTGVLRVESTLHDITAPSIRLLRFPDPSTRQSANLRYRVRFAVRDAGGAGLRIWRHERRSAGASRWIAVAHGSRQGRKRISLRADEGVVYQHRVVAADRQGNRRKSPVARVSVPLDDANARFASSYDGIWETGSATSSDFRTTLHSSSDPGASFAYSFSGTSVAWIGPGAEGVAAVTVDGGAATQIDLASSSERRVTLFEANLPPGDHTIGIAVLSGTVGLDGLVVRSEAAAATVGGKTATSASTSFAAAEETKPAHDDDGLDCSHAELAPDELCSAALPRSTPSSTYADSWYGWPVRPRHRQHPVRGSFLDPRPGGFHFGIDISVRDNRPERGHPPGRTHRVYAVEGGTVYNLVDGTGPCGARKLWVGHFAYYHVDAVVAADQHVGPGQMIGWTCKGWWHVHLSEFTAGNVLVNPLHPGGKLRPYADTKAPVVHSFAFYRVAPPLFTAPGGAVWSPVTGTRLSADDLSGIVDVRVRISDPQSFRSWLTALPDLYADLHPYRVALRVTRLSDGVTVVQRDVANPYFPYGLPLTNHFAPGTRANRRASACYRYLRRGITPPVPCAGRYWLHAFATSGGASWNTSTLANGRYRIRITAWDPLGHASTRGIDVQLDNI